MIDRLHVWVTGQPALRVFTILVRVLLALAFAPSGFVKIVGEPFTRLPISDPVGYFFAGFFSAHGYYRFIGAAQWLAGGLLLFPRTATLGALLYLPIILNIFAITLAIGPSFGGTRSIAGALLAGNVYLLGWDWDRWKAILPVASARARHGDVMTALGLLAAIGLAFAGIVGTHLARLRQADYAAPLSMVAGGGLLGIVMLVAAYKRSRRPR